jgi:nucleoside-diphosphate-sugar epimerase
MPRVLIAGSGFVGTKTAELFEQAGWEVAALTLSETSARGLSSQPFRVLACDIADRAQVAKLLDDFPDLDAVVDCVSSGRGGAEVYRRVYLDGARNLLELLAPRRFVFTSSTSVYAQTDGSEVTENSAAEPTSETSRILCETEQLVLAKGGSVARLAGIYGPGRSVLLQKFFDGTARIEGDGSRCINQIHRDDAAAALFLLGSRCIPPGIYNVADGSPMTQIECYRWMADYFRKPLPPRAEIDTNRKRGWTSKRVSNRKLRASGWQCRYPSFQDAIRNDHDLLDSMRTG